MQVTLSIAALAASVSASVLQPRLPSGCCTQLTVSGGVSGPLGQLADGQNRVGPGFGGATYCLNGGGFTDQSNRGCILTPPTTQFQCDVGAHPTTGFAIGSAGQVTSKGSPTFYACPASNGVYNIYTTPVANQKKCVQVQLKATNAQCYAAGSSSSRPYTNSTTSAHPVSSSSARPVSSSSARPVSSSSARPVSSSSARPVSSSSRPTSSSTSVRQATPSTAPRPATSSTQARAATPSTSSRPASIPANTCPPPSTVTVTHTVQAPAPPARTVTVCPSQSPAVQGVAHPASPSTSARASTTSTPARVATSSTSAHPSSSSTPARAATPSTSPRPSTSAAPARASTPSTSPRPSTSATPARAATPSTSARPQTSTTPARPNTPTTMPRPVVYTNTTRAATPASTRPASSTSARPASTCPALLSGQYQSPHLIVPVDSQSPSRAYGTSYNGTISQTMTSDFNFDIPQSYAGHTCNLVFYFPTQAQLQTSSFKQNTNGGSIRFQQLSSPVSAGTTFQHQPPASRDLAVRTVAPGNAYTIASGPCAAGKTVSYALSSVGGYSLSYFQDYNPCPIGLFITQT